MLIFQLISAIRKEESYFVFGFFSLSLLYIYMATTAIWVETYDSHICSENIFVVF